MQAPYPSDLVVSVVDNTRGGSAVPLPLVSTGSGPSTGYFQIIKLVPNDWTIVIRYPNSFQGSKSISTSIADKVSSGAVSAPLTYNMSFSGSTVSVFRMTTNGDGRITSDPPGIDCPGTCTFDFRGFSSVKLMQSVTHNMTEFIGWTGNCTGMGDCLLQLLEPGPAIIPVNPTATANFRIHVNGGIPSSMSCPAAPLIAGKRWSGQPNCGSPPPLGATLQCDAQGYFCCGPSGGNNSPRCNGGNQTAATCGADSLGVFGTNQQLIQPGGCYEAGP